MFFLVVLAHTDEQYNNYFAKYQRIYCSYQCGLIKQIFYTIDLTKATYTFRGYLSSSYVRLQSIITPRFFTDLDGAISLLSSVMLRSSGMFFSICGVPRISTFVLSGLMRRLFLQHHAAMFRRSFVSWAATKMAFRTGNERCICESST